VSYQQRVNMDTWYVFNWSLHIDLVILYKTIGVVLKKRGAY
jgi:undecaprenyl-phosphate galactose phosphotransferase